MTVKVRATVERRCASLSEPFGRDYAARLFGPDCVERLPVFVRGPKKGLTKGFLVWERAKSGGWYDTLRRVVRPNELVRAWVTAAYDGAEPMEGWWHGSQQTLRGNCESVFQAEFAHLFDAK